MGDRETVFPFHDSPVASNTWESDRNTSWRGQRAAKCAVARFTIGTGNTNKQKRQVGWHKGEEKMPFNCRTMDPLRATPSHAFTGLLTAWRSESMSSLTSHTGKKWTRSSRTTIFRKSTLILPPLSPFPVSKDLARISPRRYRDRWTGR